MPTHFEPEDFEQNFPINVDVFPTAEDHENFIDAILLNRAGASIVEIEEYLILWKENIEMASMESFEGGEGLLSFPVPVGRYAAGKTATAQDEDLVAGNIKSAVEIFGVVGDYEAGGGGGNQIALPDMAVIAEALVTITPTTLVQDSAISGIGVPGMVVV